MNLKTIGRRVALLTTGLTVLGTVVAAPSALAVTNTCPNDSGGYLWHFQNHGDSTARITVTGAHGLNCTIEVSESHGNQFYASGSTGDLTLAMKYGLYNGTFGPYANDKNTCFRITDGGELDLTTTGNDCNTN